LPIEGAALGAAMQARTIGFAQWGRSLRGGHASSIAPHRYVIKYQNEDF
jgi:hypothetical protein